MRCQPMFLRAPDGGGAPVEIKTLGDVKSVVAEMRAAAEKANAGSEAAVKGLNDLAARFDELSRDARTPHFTEERVKDFSRFIRPDGTAALVGYKADGTRRTVTKTFAGVQVEVPVQGLLDSIPADEWHADLQQLAMSHKIGTFLGADMEKSQARILAHMDRAPSTIKAALEGGVKKAMADVTGQGGDWVPDIVASDYFRDFEVTGVVAAQFAEVNMPSPDYVQPKLTVGARPYLAGANGTDDPAQYTASNITTDKQTISARKFAVLVKAEDDIVDDSIIPMLPTIMQEIAAAQADGYDDAIINGDTATSSVDAFGTWNTRGRWGSANAGSADHRKAFIGLRALAYDRAATVDQGSGQTVAKILEELVGGMGENAASNLVMFVSPEVFFRKIMVDTNVLTVDKFGSNATILRGQVAAVGGVPIIMTRWVSADLAATGLYTGSGSKSGVVVADRAAFRRYTRRQLMIESGKDSARGQYSMVATTRRTFATLAATSRKVSMFGFNWL